MTHVQRQCTPLSSYEISYCQSWSLHNTVSFWDNARGGERKGHSCYHASISWQEGLEIAMDYSRSWSKEVIKTPFWTIVF